MALAMFTAVSVSAQTIYNAANIANKDLNGTARFVGMGGAMGALGGDITTMGTNPAGIGIYRSNDAAVSFGFSSYGTESNYMGNKMSSDKTRADFNNAGFVFSTKVGNVTPLRYVNFGFNYQRVKSFTITCRWKVILVISLKLFIWLIRHQVQVVLKIGLIILIGIII